MLLVYAATSATHLAAPPIPPPAPLNLAISLVFGAGQVIVGGALAWRGLGGQRWRRVSLVALALLGLWVVCSGIAELLVSGLETTARLWGAPASGAIAAVRGAADMSLLGVALALVAGFALYLAFFWRRGLSSAHHDRSA